MKVKELLTSLIEKDNYSTTERRVGTWIDGKPIYRKTIVKNITARGNIVLAHGISNFETLVNYSFVLHGGGSNGAEYEPVPRIVTDNAAYNTGFGDVNGVNFLFQLGASCYVPATLYATFEYTKTTD